VVPAKPRLGLWEVTGCRETAVQTAPNGRTELRWTGADIPGVKPGDRLRARWYEETCEPIGPQARVVARFENGSAAAVQSEYGKGKTLMLGSYVSAAYQTTPTPEVERFYAGLLTWAGVTLPVTVTGAELEVRYLESGGDVVVFAFNHGKARATSTVSISMPEGTYTGTDLVSGHNVALSRDPQGVRFDVALDPNDVRVVKIERRARGATP
ncbi:MAG: hypothetical protein IMZ75_13070, partial [Actinobacteria bacterium]|nr:hypothetical protein [Actinomycetota bacterium]